MAADSPDWTVPAPLHALLWWPGVAFVLVLVALGAPVGAVGRRLTRLPAVADDA